jgi:hypothetical protein
MQIFRELKTANGLLCLLLTVGCLPVLIWHQWQSVEGLARVSLLGFAIADLALWFCGALVGKRSERCWSGRSRWSGRRSWRC